MFKAYTKFLPIAGILLAMLVLVPCTSKKGLKDYFGMETKSNAPQGQSKISCVTVYELQEITKKEQQKQQDTPPLLYLYSTTEAKPTPVKSVNSYLFFKEKIRTHLLYQQFLI